MHTCFEYSARQNFLCLINIYKWWNCAFSWGILTGKLRWHYKLQYMIAMLFVQIPLLWPFRHLGSNTGSLVKYTRSIFLIACEISRVVNIFYTHPYLFEIDTWHSHSNNYCYVNHNHIILWVFSQWAFLVENVLMTLKKTLGYLMPLKKVFNSSA